MKRKSVYYLGAAVLTVLFASGVVLLVTPTNPLTRFFQVKISSVNAPVVVGPYPSDEDLKLLKENDVKVIVSLLDSRLPYEKILLEREKQKADSYGFRLVNFPMSSVLGKAFGDDYQKNAEAAANEIIEEKGKTYLHCYLGVHRAKVVQALIESKHKSTAKYIVRESERSEDARFLDQAEASFGKGQYDKVVQVLKQIKRPNASAHTLLGWSYYRTGETGAARVNFLEARQLNPNDMNNNVGLGFCALKDEDLAAAEKAFEKIPAKDRDSQCLLGLGILAAQRDRVDDAKRWLREAAEKDPQNQEAKDLLEKLSK